MLEVVIILVICIAVWGYVHYSKKSHASDAGSSVGAVSAQEVTQEPVQVQVVGAEPEPIVEKAAEPEILDMEPVTVETIEVSEVADVIPEDSTLRRHYLQNLSIQEGSPEVIAEADETEEESTGAVIENNVIKSNTVENSSKSSVPEDTVLKRHFIQQLVAKTEAKMPPRPTDSTLKRHYDTQLMSSVLSQLEELG